MTPEQIAKYREAIEACRRYPYLWPNVVELLLDEVEQVGVLQTELKAAHKVIAAMSEMLVSSAPYSAYLANIADALEEYHRTVGGDE